MVKTVSDQLAVAISHARLFRHVQTQAMTDSLTGLYNHRYFQERLERELKLADRNDDKVSLILLDLDHLKRINDSLGHRAGDAALCHVAHLMQTTVRGVDICARYGGEEFVVILPQCDREGAIMVAERLREVHSLDARPENRTGDGQHWRRHLSFVGQIERRAGRDVRPRHVPRESCRPQPRPHADAPGLHGREYVVALGEARLGFSQDPVNQPHLFDKLFEHLR